MPTVAEPIVEHRTSSSQTEEDELLVVEDLDHMEFDEIIELVEGKIKYMGNNNPNHSELLFDLSTPIKNFLKENPIGKLYGGDVRVLTRRGPDTSRGADLAFISNASLETQPKNVSSIHVAPELIIEILSPGNDQENMNVKMKEYFEIGVKEVWIVSLAIRTLTVHTSLTESTGYGADSIISSPEILPGFELKLQDLFAALPPIEG